MILTNETNNINKSSKSNVSYNTKNNILKLNLILFKTKSINKCTV